MILLRRWSLLMTVASRSNTFSRVLAHMVSRNSWRPSPSTSLPAYGGTVRTKRAPDLLLPREWALEVKLARPFGDNGNEAESWSVNLLHPYEGNVSLIGDCLKLQKLGGPERKGAVVVGYEHSPPRIRLAPLLEAFELIADRVVGIRLGSRVHVTRSGLCHPVHQQLLVAAWEVL